MNNTKTCSIERIIAKIDNDFNPDSSDWIPRVAAWCMDAMSMLDVLPVEKKKFCLPVENRKASSDCPLDMPNLKVYDENGCEVKKSDEFRCCGFDFPTGGCGCGSGNVNSSESGNSGNEVEPTVRTSSIQTLPGNDDYISSFAETRTSKDYPSRYNVQSRKVPYGGSCDRKYRFADPCTIEVNFDTSKIYVTFDSPITKTSDIYGCDLPVIPNNGLLIEAVTYYCMYKMLCRGYKHAVFSLAASQYGTNPFFQWNQLKDEAKRSVTNQKQGDVDQSKIFRSNLYISTFDPRN